jgi:DNA-binding NtrC family response regulator
MPAANVRSFSHVTTSIPIPEVIMVGASDHIRKVRVMCDTVARTPFSTNALITGETGTGKELVARLIHNSNSPRLPFVAVNCGEITETTLQSQFFGHDKGSFTDARERKAGFFEQAANGTLVLDEVSEVPFEKQSVFLRAIQERRFRPMGLGADLPIQARILASTNLTKGDFQKKVRFDLYQRLSTVHIKLLPLRDRPCDIPLLADYFLRTFAAKHSKGFEGFTPCALNTLRSYSWPGNIRELSNVIERTVIFSPNNSKIGAEVLEIDTPDGCEINSEPKLVNLPATGASLAEIRREAIVQALVAAHWQQNAAAKLLRTSPQVIQYQMKKLGIEIPD